MFQAIILGNGKGSQKLERKIDDAVNNFFYFTIFVDMSSKYCWEESKQYLQST